MADLFKLNSLTLHYAYFVLTPMIVSVIYYATHKDDLRYVDALFMCFSAVTGTGIDVVDVSSQNSIQQGLLFALIIMGHAIPICGVLSLRRAWSLRAALRDDTCNNDMRCIIDADKEKVTTAVKELPPCLPSPTESETAQEDYGFITIVETTHDESAKEVSPKTVAGQKNPSSSAQSYILRVPASLRAMTQSVGEHVKQQRSIDYNQTGGVECLSVTLISILVIVYFLGFLCLGIVGIGVWSHVFRPDIAHAGGVSAFWGGSFLAVSALCNNGMSLITTNMGPFQREAFPLLTAGFLVLAGNTLFPCLLRLLVWVIRKFIPRHPEWNLWRQVLDHTLDQSQSVCDYLYPSWHTWFLLGTVIVLNCIMWIAFELSAIHNEEIGSLPPGYRILDGLFQALSVRGGGFSVVPFDQLGQGLLILYGLMMYLSAFPVSTTISNLESFRKSFSASPNGDDFNYAADKSNPHLSQFARARFVYQQLRSQFDNDMWWLCLAILLITVTESNNYKAHPLSFSTFNIIFEVISAYSCVGETMGFPGKSYAFSGEWHTFSKLLLIAVSLRGKIRSMPLKLESIDSHQKNMLDDLKCKN